MARLNCALDRSIKQHSLREIDFPFFSLVPFHWSYAISGFSGVVRGILLLLEFSRNVHWLGFLKFLAGWGFYIAGMFFHCHVLSSQSSIGNVFL